jgi:pimeloyl-ACP methyl ester carboxylesterase
MFCLHWIDPHRPPTFVYVSVIAHSYGTFVTSVLCQRQHHRITSACLIDPVCFGVFMPNLLGNFVYRWVRTEVQWLPGNHGNQVYLVISLSQDPLGRL